jgi:VanZ family protein
MLRVLDRRGFSFFVAVGLVVALSIVAYRGGVPGFVAAHGADKVLHAAMGFTLALLLTRALRGRALLAAAVVFVPIALDEYLQRFSATRTSDWSDLIADIVGIGIATVVSKRRALRSSREAPGPLQADADHVDLLTTARRWGSADRRESEHGV